MVEAGWWQGRGSERNGNGMVCVNRSLIGRRNHSLLTVFAIGICGSGHKARIRSSVCCHGPLTRKNQVRHAHPWEGGHTACMLMRS
jgi:hypothetical protein